MTVFDIALNTGRKQNLDKMSEHRKQLAKLDEFKDKIDGVPLSKTERKELIDKFIQDNNLYMLVV